MVLEEDRDLARGLEPGYVRVQVDPVEALDIQHRVLVEQIVDRDRTGDRVP